MALLSWAVFLPVALSPSSVPRRALLAAPLALAAAPIAAGPRAAHAASTPFAAKLRDAEAALSAADSSSVLEQINNILELATDYGGMPTTAYREELVRALLAKRGELRASGGWDNEKEEQYLRVQRTVDPWRVVQLESSASGAVFAFAPAYVGLLAVQQLVPKLFNVAYAGAVLLLFGPLLFQILFG